jgi:hypothetical protein
MIGRIVLGGAMLLAVGVASASAGSPMGFWMLKKACPDGNQVQSQCAIQISVGGDGNKARTEQSTDRRGADQFALTFQNGNDNIAYTGQIGKDQVSLTSQNGDNNASYVFQSGDDNFTKHAQSGNGTWAASSSIGDDSHVIVTVSN